MQQKDRETYIVGYDNDSNKYSYNPIINQLNDLSEEDFARYFEEKKIKQVYIEGLPGTHFPLKYMRGYGPMIRIKVDTDDKLDDFTKSKWVEHEKNSVLSTNKLQKTKSMFKKLIDKENICNIPEQKFQFVENFGQFQLKFINEKSKNLNRKLSTEEYNQAICESFLAFQQLISNYETYKEYELKNRTFNMPTSQKDPRMKLVSRLLNLEITVKGLLTSYTQVDQLSSKRSFNRARARMQTRESILQLMDIYDEENTLIIGDKLNLMKSETTNIISFRSNSNIQKALFEKELFVDKKKNLKDDDSKSTSQSSDDSFESVSLSSSGFSEDRTSNFASFENVRDLFKYFKEPENQNTQEPENQNTQDPENQNKDPENQNSNLNLNFSQANNSSVHRSMYSQSDNIIDLDQLSQNNSSVTSLQNQNNSQQNNTEESEVNKYAFEITHF